MEYVLALVTLAFGFIFGRIIGKLEGARLERHLSAAVYSGHTVILAVGERGTRTYLKEGVMITEPFEYKEEVE